MGRYSDLYREIHRRDPPPLNLEVGKEHVVELETYPRRVKGAYGRKVVTVEVTSKGKKFTLYISQVDLLNRFANLYEKSKGALKGKKVFIKRKSKSRFEVDLRAH